MPNYHALAVAIEYEVMFQEHLEDVSLNDWDDGEGAREEFYWENIARPFARSHGAFC